MSADLPTPGAPLMLIVSVRGPGSGLAVVDPPDIHFDDSRCGRSRPRAAGQGAGRRGNT